MGVEGGHIYATANRWNFQVHADGRHHEAETSKIVTYGRRGCLHSSLPTPIGGLGPREKKGGVC